MAWYDWDDPGPWKSLGEDPTLKETVIAAAKQVSDDNYSSAHSETDSVQSAAYYRVAEAFESFARMLETGEHR